MRKLLALILCLACFSGCAGFRQRTSDIGEHFADGPGWLIARTWRGIVSHAPGFAAETAVNSAGDVLDSKLDDATAGHESPGERQQRKIDRTLDSFDD
jgi:hypothetical protein